MLDGYTYLYTLPTGARTKRKKGKGEILWRLDEHRGRNIYQKYIIIDGLEVALIFWLLFFPFVQYSSWSTMGDFIFCVGWVHILSPFRPPMWLSRSRRRQGVENAVSDGRVSKIVYKQPHTSSSPPLPHSHVQRHVDAALPVCARDVGRHVGFVAW